jgi:hypothetical protein
MQPGNLHAACNAMFEIRSRTTISSARYGASLPHPVQRISDIFGFAVIKTLAERGRLVEFGSGVCIPQCRHTTPEIAVSIFSIMIDPRAQNDPAGP